MWTLIFSILKIIGITVWSLLGAVGLIFVIIAWNYKPTWVIK